jgi:Fe-S-cluster containining protein
MSAFNCKMCGDCCYGEGGITLRAEEVGKIADFLGISSHSFRGRYCETRNGRLSITAGADRFCIFSQQRGCLIHPVKPRVCASWPFYPAILRDEQSWELAKDACPGINRDCEFAEFVRQSRE